MPQSPVAGTPRWHAGTPEWIGRLNAVGVLNVKMESAALVVVALLRGAPAGMICACSSNLVSGARLYTDIKPALTPRWRASIQAALETCI